MRQYTNEIQTAKLIELGFEKPKNTIYKQVAKRKFGYGVIEWEDAGEEGSYSIGELIEMLPAKIDGTYCNIDRCGQRSWAISYDPMIYCCNCAELVDALYDMVVNLKEEGVI